MPSWDSDIQQNVSVALKAIPTGVNNYSESRTALLKNLLERLNRPLTLKFYHTQLTSLDLCAHMNQTELGMLAHTGKPSTQKAETKRM